jgi:class III poly(R)-hydroxyalkanoic acid synthase PhaE subunit
VNKEGYFSDDWLETQRKYWESWTEMSRKAMGLEGGDVTSPWQAALDHWWKAVSPTAPDASKQLMERMMDQGKSLFKMVETFLPGAAGGGDAWGAFSKALDDMQKGFIASLGGMGEGGNGLHRRLAFWELPYDNWQRMASSLSPLPGDLLRNMPHDAVKEHIDKVLSAPGLGYTREEQGAYQELMRCGLSFQKAFQDYTAFYSQLGIKAIDRLRGRMQELITSGKTIDSARAIYDDWVNCCEAVYAEEVSTPAYAQLHGDLINAQMAFKRRLSVMVDENLGALNMPTRAEIRTLQDRLQEIRRENKRIVRDLNALKHAVEGAPVRALPQQPAPVRSALTSAVPAAAIKQPVARKKTGAKPTAPTTK